jgi:glyoxylase I family protein
MKKIAIAVAHICLEVANVKRSLKFWAPLAKATGLERMRATDDFAGFSRGVFALYVCRSKPRRVVKKKPTGSEYVVADHLAFRVGKRGDVDELARRMRKAGFEPLFPPEEHSQFTPGYYAVSFADPDNNVVELYSLPGKP